MKFSILTSSVGRSTLQDLYKCLLNQSYPNWEWIIVFDGKKGYTDLVESFNDPLCA